MATAHPRQRRRIEIDVLFAPVPQALVLDTKVSAAACRLWSVLYVFRWNDTPPDFDKLAAAMDTTERSVYRWLQELESKQWIAWDRNAQLADRFTLCMTPDATQIDTDVNSDASKLTPRSNKLTPRSNKLIVVSEELTQVSILDVVDPIPVPQNDTPSSDQKIQKDQNHDPTPTPTHDARAGGGGVGGFYEQDVCTLLGGYNIMAARKIAAQYAAMPDPPSIAIIREAVEQMFDDTDPRNLKRIARRLMDCAPPYVVPVARAASSTPIAPAPPHLADPAESQAALQKMLAERKRPDAVPRTPDEPGGGARSPWRTPK